MELNIENLDKLVTAMMMDKLRQAHDPFLEGPEDEKYAKACRHEAGVLFQIRMLLRNPEHFNWMYKSFVKEEHE